MSESTLPSEGSPSGGPAEANQRSAGLPGAVPTQQGLSKALLENLARPRNGRVHDLELNRFPGMPMWSGHPPFQVVTYRTPPGTRAQNGGCSIFGSENTNNVGVVSEMVIATQHSGAHMGALGHITSGPDDQWYNGNARENLGDFGLTEGDGSELPALITRGVLVDVAAALGLSRLEKGHPITVGEFERALSASGTELQRGDVVLVRTGQLSVWPDAEALAETHGPGITREVADLCVDSGASAVGADTESLEVQPSVVPDNPHPVHERLLVEAGVHILENIYLEELSREGVGEFLFLALPPKISGATGGMVRPVAIT